MVDYEVVDEQGIRLNRRHAKGETVKLSPGQARYLLLNGKIKPAGTSDQTGDEEN